MSTLAIIDRIALEAAGKIPDALRADLLDADRVISDPVPNALMAAHEDSARDLADALFLALTHDACMDRLPRDFDMEFHFDDAATSFLNRLSAAQRATGLIPERWIKQGQDTVFRVYRERLQRFWTGPAGGGVA